MIRLITRFFDKLEDKVRMKLSHRSIIYAIIGGTCTILLWRGVWHTADIVEMQLLNAGSGWWLFFYGPIPIIWCSIALLMTGLFVSQFIGERIIISGIKNEKKVTDKTESEIVKEEQEISDMTKKFNKLSEKTDMVASEIVEDEFVVRDVMKKISQISRDIEEIKNSIAKNKSN